MKQLSGTDALFLQHLESRLPELPVMRRRLHTVPFHLDHPVDTRPLGREAKAQGNEITFARAGTPAARVAPM